MKKIVIIVIIIFCYFCSCKSTFDLYGTKYTYKSKQRKLELKFVNDSICTLTNLFYCPDIETEYQIIVQEFTYNRNGESIYVRNKNPKYGNDLYIEIPVQNSSVCDFLNENKRKMLDRTKVIYIGPNYSSDYEKHGRVPNITTDTLILMKNHIFYYKKTINGSFGFIFKKSK